MTNQIIQVPDIAVVKTVGSTKQLFSLRDQKVKKEALQNFGVGSGIKHEGDLYVLDGGIIPIVRMTTSKVDPAFFVGKTGDIEVDWGDGTREVNVFSHVYTDGNASHEVVFYGKNNALSLLNCDRNQLTQLDVGKNVALTQLMCDCNQLTHLNINRNIALKFLVCSSNQIGELDVSQNVALTHLLCDYNQLTRLDVTPNTLLSQFWCGFNQFTQLDVSQNTVLKELTCYSLHLTHLDVSRNTILEKLGCSTNQLTQLDVSQNIQLRILYCLECPLVLNYQSLNLLANSLPIRSKSNKGDLLIGNQASWPWIQTICDEKNWVIR